MHGPECGAGLDHDDGEAASEGDGVPAGWHPDVDASSDDVAAGVVGVEDALTYGAQELLNDFGVRNCGREDDAQAGA